VSNGGTNGAGEPATGPLDTEVTAGPDRNSALTVAGPAVPDAAPVAATAAADGEPKRRNLPRWVPDTIVLLVLLAGGVAVTWPRASYLVDGKVPLDSDQSQYIWNFWWVAKQVSHLGNPFFTNYLAAPVGVRLGYDTLTPLLGVVMTPVTMLFGPTASYNFVTIVTPGLAAFALYRVARLWLPSRTGAIAAGAFYGYSSMLTSQVWLHLHTAFGCIFLPLTLEAAIRLRRRPGTARGIVLGVVVGCALLVDQELAVMAIVVAVLALVPWLIRQREPRAFWASAVAVVSSIVVSSPQIYAVVKASGKEGPSNDLYGSYTRYAARLPGLFAPSPHLASYGLTGLASIYSQHMTVLRQASHANEMAATFGIVLTLTALGGLVVAWRRRGTGRLALLWLGSIILALGPTLFVNGTNYVPLATMWHGIRVSRLMPYSWMIRFPVLSSFREADRLALLGLVAAALLAGAAVDWLRWNGRLVIIAVAVLGALEAGWSGIQGARTAPASLPAVDGPIAADHSGSVVVDVPFVISGPVKYGVSEGAPQYALNLATQDGHPRAMSYVSGVPMRTIDGIKAHPFYSGLVDAENGAPVTPAQLAAARQDLRTLHIGWVVIWGPTWTPSFPLGHIDAKQRDRQNRRAIQYLDETGFKFDYRADGVLVYRPAGS
jgi:hypothetical protein